MVKDYKYYKNLPELDEAKIESLIRPSNEVDDFIKKGKKSSMTLSLIKKQCFFTPLTK